MPVLGCFLMFLLLFHLGSQPVGWMAHIQGRPSLWLILAQTHPKLCFTILAVCPQPSQGDSKMTHHRGAAGLDLVIRHLEGL